MTTFQDPPPQSRRAVRQSERGEAAPATPAEAQQYSFDATIGQTHAADPSAPISTNAPAPTEAPVAPPLMGRRQARAADQTSDSFVPQAPTGQPAPQQAPLVGGANVAETAEQAAYRMRDFSPEGGRRAAKAAASAASFPPPARPVELGYQTLGVQPTAATVNSLPLEDTLNHTLSRRELREMRAAAEAQSQPAQSSAPYLPEPIDALLNSGPIDIPTLAPPPGQSQALADAMAEFDLLTRSRREAEARARDAQVASLATPIVAPSTPPQFEQQSSPLQELWEPYPTSAPQAPFAPAAEIPAPFPVAEAPIADVPITPVPSAPFQLQPQPVDQLLAYPPTATLPSPPVPVESAPAASAPVQSVPLPVSQQPNVLPQPDFTQQPSVPQEDDQHGGRSPRASGHWRMQAALEDDDTPFETTISRTVGSNTSAITTSALVLPSVPQPGGGLLNTVTATGEILVTGTIDLPKSLGTTGAHPGRLDNSDYEDDPFDSQIQAPDSAPVRAIRAISTNTSTRGIIETKRPQGSRMLTVVIIVASGLCVGLVGLLVFAFASGKL